jgi:hypothetical protein
MSRGLVVGIDPCSWIGPEADNPPIGSFFLGRLDVEG